MPLPSLVPTPLFKRGFSSLALVPRSRAGNTFRIKVKDGVIGHYQQFLVGDILRAKVWNGTSLIDNWLRVEGVTNPGASAGYYSYFVSRMYGTAGLIPAGTAIVNYGPSGSSFISLSSDGAIGAAPNITIGKHTGQPWLTSTTLVKLGNLNGDYGITSNLYGFGVGDYSGGNYLKYNATDGLVLKTANGGVSIDGSGVVITGGPLAVNRITWGTQASPTGEISVYDTQGISGVTSGFGSYGNVASITLNAGAPLGSSITFRVFQSAPSSYGYAYLYSNGSGGASVGGLTLGANSTPKAMLDVRGGLAFNVTTVTTTYTILSTDSTVVCNSASPFTVTLPTAVVNQVFTIKNIGAGVVTIDGAGTDTIDGALTKSLNQYDSATLQCTAANTWSVI